MSFRHDFENNGFVLVKHAFEHDDLTSVEKVLWAFHQAWLEDNREFYHQRAINSAYLTEPTYLSDEQRLVLFQFIGSAKMAGHIKALFADPLMFVGTQLFFDPYKSEQKNYWHRDIQYGMSLDQQKEALSGPRALHFRVALKDERGIELVPGSHRCWDTADELAVRCEQDGHTNSEDLKSGVSVPLQRGDMLVFDAKMIHRGLYGGDRLAFDVLLADPDPSLKEIIHKNGLPSDEQLENVLGKGLFQNTVRFLNDTSQQ